MGKPAENATPIDGSNGTRYHGVPCPKHGTTERYTCNKACVSCTRARAAARPRYGLTQEQVDLLLVVQSGACAICSATEPGSNNGWCVDHDHETGVARGVLCHSCNVGLGFFRDSAVNLRRAAEYLTDDTQAARMFFVREINFAVAGDVEPRERTADVTGHRGAKPGHGRFGPRPRREVPREEYLARRRETYRQRKQTP